jgi:hypothetical protein
MRGTDGFFMCVACLGTLEIACAQLATEGPGGEQWMEGVTHPNRISEDVAKMEDQSPVAEDSSSSKPRHL